MIPIPQFAPSAGIPRRPQESAIKTQHCQNPGLRELADAEIDAAAKGVLHSLRSAGYLPAEISEVLRRAVFMRAVAHNRG